VIAGRFLSRQFPPFDRVLLVESGSRETAQAWLQRMRNKHPQMKCDLLTCYAGAPAGFDGEMFSVHNYPDSDKRNQLFNALASPGRYSIIAILCTAEPIMTKWKWATVAKVRSKVMIVNENADFFWLDRANWPAISHFILYRADLTGGDAVRTLLRLLLFPFTVLFLVAYAAMAHTRRLLRFS
jgi:hypothetical protein